MTHFVCSGTCKCESERAEACRDSSCSRYGQPLEACNCRDMKHLEVKHRPHEAVSS